MASNWKKMHIRRIIFHHFHFLALLCAACAFSLVSGIPQVEDTPPSGTGDDGKSHDGVERTPTLCVVQDAQPFVMRKKFAPKILTNVSRGLHITQNEEYSLESFFENFEGFDVDVMKAVTRLAFQNSEVRVRVHKTFPRALYDVRIGKCDAGVSSFTRTAYRSQCDECPSLRPGQEIDNTLACCLRFTDTYFWDGITFGATRAPVNPGKSLLLALFFQPFMLKAISVLALALIASGHLVWWIEKGRNHQQFPASYLDGVDEGIWWSFVTMTTVGYGDRVPVTIMGRFLACIWMIVGIVLFGLFNASIVMSLGQHMEPLPITGPEDVIFNNYQICTTRGSFEDWINSTGLAEQTHYAETISDCYQMLQDPKIDLVLYDRLALLLALEPLNHGPSMGMKTSARLPGSIGMEVSKAFDISHFAWAMPWDGYWNEALSNAIASLVAGEVVYSTKYDEMNFGFNLAKVNRKWAYYNVPLGEAKLSDPGPMPHEWDQAIILLCCTLAIVAVYTVGQFGGLWFRRVAQARSRKSKWNVMRDICRNNGSLKEYPSDCRDDSFVSKKLPNAISDLQKEVSEIARANEDFRRASIEYQHSTRGTQLVSGNSNKQRASPQRRNTVASNLEWVLGFANQDEDHEKKDKLFKTASNSIALPGIAESSSNDHWNSFVQP